MGDNLAMADAHPNCEVVGLCDRDLSRTRAAQMALQLADDQVFADWQICIEKSRPDFLLLCPSTGDHLLWIQRLAPYGLPILIEKPMAASLAEADEMIEVCRHHDVVWAINWPLVWVPSHRTAKRIVDEGRIGQLLEVHFYDGNRGPLWHTAGKLERTAEQVQLEKPDSWFYSKADGGGSLLDYLGYGTTLGTWFFEGQKPLEVTSITDQPHGLEVDEHSITIAKYACGLSKFETRWGTFTDPWTYQPQPNCGFILVGSAGTISSFDYQPTIRIQDLSHPEGYEMAVDEIEPPHQNPVQYFVDCLQHGRPIQGPLSPETSRIGQQIVDTAYQSAEQKRTLTLLE